jgi:hypothetical protein
MFTGMHLVLYSLSVLTASSNGKRIQRNAFIVASQTGFYILAIVLNAMGKNRCWIMIIRLYL